MGVGGLGGRAGRGFKGILKVRATARRRERADVANETGRKSSHFLTPCFLETLCWRVF